VAPVTGAHGSTVPGQQPEQWYGYPAGGAQRLARLAEREPRRGQLGEDLDGRLLRPG
jgi:hypothetical protein